jgi:hypothetical protein
MLSNKFHRFSLFRLLSLVRQQSNIARDNNGYKSSTEKTILDQYLANITVTSFYCQSAIEQLALKVLFNSFLIKHKIYFTNLATNSSFTINNDVYWKNRR